jgi:UDP-2,3-diacylglucosamine pyrophosphatase LpxH
MPDYAVVLSDVHIGNDANTCWYQSTVHEPYLVAALDWVVDNAESVKEVVLLGDLVDTWTYPPSTPPPSMADIIAANPNVLGAEGALARVVNAVPKASFLRGNHDAPLTQADMTALQQSVGQVDEIEGPLHVLTGSTGARTVFSHGHYWTMFNAPDNAAPWGDDMPVGHFVTRAFSYMMANRLQAGETVADLANMGYPNGPNLIQFLSSLGPNTSPDIAGLLLDYVSTAAGMPPATPVVLPNGASTTITQAKQIYADLFTNWVAQENGSTQNAARAAKADDSGEALAWFAQRLAIQESADLVVMGHTHTPVGGLTVAPINYVNSGFGCASVPDNPPKLFTFAVVDLNAAAAEIFMVRQGDYAIDKAGAAPLPSVVLGAFMDFSCYVRILNRSEAPLTLNRSSAAHGYWVVPPPETIPAGGRGDAWLQDYTGPQGSEGAFSYQGGGDFSVSCPTGLSTNTASGAGGNFVARSGSGAWSAPGTVPTWGHPLEVTFTVGG